MPPEKPTLVRPPPRPHGRRGRPATRPAPPRLQVAVTEDPAAVAAAVRRLGWRVYGANAPGASLGLEQAVLAYRSAYVIERGFGRLTGRPLSLSPLYLERDDHVTGLLRLLSIGLRVLTVLEYVVRQALAASGATLAGLSAGNPKRVTARPTTEALLRAFKDVTLTVVTGAGQCLRHLTPLSPLQQRILALVDFPQDLYTRLAAPLPQPP